MLLRVIIATEDVNLRRRLRALLASPDIVLEAVRGKRLLWERAARKGADVILASESVVPDPVASSLELVKNLPESAVVAVISDSDDPLHHARLLGAGFDMVLHAGLPEKELISALEAVLSKRQEAASESLSDQQPLAQPQFSDFVSDSPAMQEFMRVVHRIVNTDTSLLILGETGVGKERLARAIHAEGPRSDGPFVPVNCGALAESLLESELFGHEEGSFTGATRSRRGCFEIAHGGTIFLDEVGEMPTHLQVKLLRVLQDHEIQRVGGEKPLAVDVRVMAASNRNLHAEVESGGFRRDLYYRLSVVSLEVPSLRQRRQDIPALTHSYIDYFRSRIGHDIHGIEPDAMAALCEYAWPGNVRELMNVIERAILLCDGKNITVDDMPTGVAGGTGLGWLSASVFHGREMAIPQGLLAKPLKQFRAEIIQNVEIAYLTALLRKTNGRIGKTAELAGIEPRSLYEKMKKYALQKEVFRQKRTSGSASEDMQDTIDSAEAIPE